MKKYLLIILLSLYSVLAKAQATNDKQDTSTKKIHMLVEMGADFPGGVLRFKQWIIRKVEQYSSGRSDNAQGAVKVEFTIDKDGSISNANVIKSLSTETDAIALRIIKESPKWRPAMQNNQPVSQKFSIDVNFSKT